LPPPAKSGSRWGCRRSTVPLSSAYCVRSAEYGVLVALSRPPSAALPGPGVETDEAPAPRLALVPARHHAWSGVTTVQYLSPPPASRMPEAIRQNPSHVPTTARPSTARATTSGLGAMAVLFLVLVDFSLCQPPHSPVGRNGQLVESIQRGPHVLRPSQPLASPE